MSTLKQALYQHLTADAEVAAIVSNRVYPGVAPKDAPLPYITYQRISSQHERHMTGRAGVAHPRMQINCWSSSGITLETLVNEVRLALDRFAGAMGTVALNVLGAYLENIRDDQLLQAGASETVYHKASMEFIIWHAET